LAHGVLSAEHTGSFSKPLNLFLCIAALKLEFTLPSWQLREESFDELDGRGKLLSKDDRLDQPIQSAIESIMRRTMDCKIGLKFTNLESQTSFSKTTQTIQKLQTTRSDDEKRHKPRWRRLNDKDEITLFQAVQLIHFSNPEILAAAFLQQGIDLTTCWNKKINVFSDPNVLMLNALLSPDKILLKAFTHPYSSMRTCREICSNLEFRNTWRPHLFSGRRVEWGLSSHAS
jgi:hypothetical protein